MADKVWRFTMDLNADPTVAPKQEASWKEGSLQKRSRFGATDEEQTAFAKEHPGEIVIGPAHKPRPGK